MPQQRGAASLQGNQLEIGGKVRRWGGSSGLPAPEGIGALGLKALFPQSGKPRYVEAGGGGDPAGGAGGLLDGLAQQSGGDGCGARPARMLMDAEGETEMLHLPAAAASVGGRGHDQPEDPGQAVPVAAMGQEYERRQRAAPDQAGDEPTRNSQKQGALEQGLQRQEGRVIEQGQMPALQTLDPQIRGRPARRATDGAVSGSRTGSIAGQLAAGLGVGDRDGVRRADGQPGGVGPDGKGHGRSPDRDQSGGGVRAALDRAVTPCI